MALKKWATWLKEYHGSEISDADREVANGLIDEFIQDAGPLYTSYIVSQKDPVTPFTGTFTEYMLSMLVSNLRVELTGTNEDPENFTLNDAQEALVTSLEKEALPLITRQKPH